LLSGSNVAHYPDTDERLALAENCERCPDLVACRNRISWGVGPRDASVVVVGEAPGAGTPDADRWRGGNWTGMAYTSRHSGRRIRSLLADAGVAGDCYLTNAVKCFPCDGGGSNREPTATEREHCRSYLREELDHIDPRVIVPTGKHATESVLALDGETGRSTRDGFLDLVLDPVECPALGVTAVPLLHPSYRDVWVSRLGHTNDSYEQQVERVLAEVTG
jgi:uracil-DNA glycosylase family 4